MYKLKEKYDTDIALLKEVMLDMQQLLKNPEKLAEISRSAKPEILRIVLGQLVIFLIPTLLHSFGVQSHVVLFLRNFVDTREITTLYK